MKDCLDDISTAVYFHVGSDGNPLYVGCSVNPFARFQNHASVSEWATQVVRMDVSWFPDRESALAFELAEIERLSPPFNMQFNKKAKRKARTNRGRELLLGWMTNTGTSVEAFAQAISATPKRAGELVATTCWPRIPMKYRIVLATSGWVPMAAWDPHPHSRIVGAVTADVAAREFKSVSDWLKECGPQMLQPNRSRGQG